MTHTIPGTSIQTSPLGFGCGSLSGGLSRRDSNRLVETALDAGFLHFDVAPLYGLGLAEEILGSALKGRRDHVTIATKAGIPRPQGGGAAAIAKSLIRPFFSLTPTLRRRLGAKAAATLSGPVHDYSPSAVTRSLEDSLRQLRTNYVDLFLLHEVTAPNITDELLSCLQCLKKSGKVRSYGVATEPSRATEIMEQWPDLREIVQTSWQIADRPAMLNAARFMITYRVLKGVHRVVSRLLAQDPALLARARQIAGIDVAQNDALATMLILTALSDNPGGIVLLSTSSMERVKRYGALNGTGGDLERGQRFRELLQSMRGAVNPCARTAHS